MTNDYHQRYRNVLKKYCIYCRGLENEKRDNNEKIPRN